MYIPPQYLQCRRELRQSFDSGQYQRVVLICNEMILGLANETSADLARALRLFLNERARAHRNLGRMQDALQDYVRALQSAHETGTSQEIAWQLVLFGKIFGKYLERHTLFSACLREAEHRYKILLEESSLNVSPNLVIQFAIVQDLLGSHYRRLGERDSGARIRCEEAYKLSLEHHKRAGNLEGIGRATCHLAYMRALFAGMNLEITKEERTRAQREALLLFEEGLRIVMRLSHASRGRATRRAQQAHIYLMLGNCSHAASLAQEAIMMAQEHNDPRAIVFSRRVLAFSLVRAGRSVEAVRELENAFTLAKELRFSGFERRILAELAELYLGRDEWQKAIDALQENERLAQKELLEFDTGFGGALEVFRNVAPDRADRYIREGQRQDYEDLITELINNSRLLRQLVGRFEESLSSKRQEAVLSFVKKAWRHSLKNDLNVIATILLRIKSGHSARGSGKDRMLELMGEAEAMLAKISNQLGSEAAGGTFEHASLKAELEQVAGQLFDVKRMRIELSHDLVFPGLAPEVLRYAFRHLLENARTAVDLAPPQDPATPLVHVRQEVTPQGITKILIMNPGINPIETPTEDSGGVVHGFANARWLFREVLGFDCWFELRGDGPRTYPQYTNCVVIGVPPPGASLSLFRIEAIP